MLSQSESGRLFFCSQTPKDGIYGHVNLKSTFRFSMNYPLFSIDLCVVPNV